MNKLSRFASAAFVAVSCATAVHGKEVGEALNDMSQVQDTDPNGFKLMVFCIGMLVVVAATLIGVTTFYAFKGKKKAK